MVSRDTRIHAAVVLASIVAVLLVTRAYPDLDSPILTFVVLVFYGFVLAGAHLFLAWLGEDGIVPVSSRWRFVGLVALVLVCAGLVALTDPVSIGGVDSDAVLTGTAILAALAYWVLEARAGYLDSTREAT